MKIVILDANSLGKELDLSVFKSLGALSIYGFTNKEEVIERIRDVDVIITNKVLLNEANLKHASKLKLICLTATGTNNIDKCYTVKNNIRVCNVINYSTESVAQHTFAILFYLYENLAYYDKYIKEGTYIDDDKYRHYEKRFFELKGKTWGIIGFGNIGKRVAEIASVFGCNIIYYSTTGKNTNCNYPLVDLDTLMSTSDIVSIHAPLNERTHNLITLRELNTMKPSAYLLNLGRGGIINEEDLVKAIEEKMVLGVALDVLENEPMALNSPFIKIKDNPRLFITPHIGWASVEARNRMVQEVYKNIEAFSKGEYRNVVSK
ncbi:MAG: hydroxyacid dehydrogenase [Firmicutes bacterium HGW-Firmicutes-7]|nr:MAG: hydroxyacid dehydrogenase [Firmicutes bacterium HGW-Firmicutes-7]